MQPFSSYINERDYDLFCEAVDQYLINPENMNEGLISYFKDKIDFIKELASKFSIELEKLLVLFKDKFIFGFFSKIGWSVSKLTDIVQAGYKIHKQLHDIIFEWAKENKVVQWTTDKIQELDDFLKKHPNVKRFAGLAVAGFLIYQWTQLVSFTGEVDFDFDQTALFQALMGSYSLTDIFGGANGLKMLTFILTGTLAKISLPYPGPTWLLFAFSIAYTVAKYKYPAVATAMKPMLKKVSVLKQEK